MNSIKKRTRRQPKASSKKFGKRRRKKAIDPIEQIKRISQAQVIMYLSGLSKPARPTPSQSATNENLRSLSKQIRLTQIQQRALMQTFGGYYSVDLESVSQPKHREIMIEGIDRRIVEVYDIDLKIRQLAHEHAESQYEIAKREGYEEYLPSRPEDRFIGMLGAWAFDVSVYGSIAQSLLETTFGGPDDCDLKLDDSLFDVKTNRSREHQLNVNQDQFDKRGKQYTAYIAVKIPVNPNAKIKELIEQCSKAYILGYAEPREIRWVFDHYKVDKFDKYYGYLPSSIYNKETRKYDKDYINPWCYINANKLHDTNKFGKDAIAKRFKHKKTGETVDPRLDKGKDI